MITKTIGVGGDFADLGLAWSWVWVTLCGSNNLLPIPDHIKFTIISDFIENTGMFLGVGITVNFNALSLTIENPGGYTSTFAVGTLRHRIFATTGSLNDIVNVTGLKIIIPSNIMNVGVLTICAGNQGNRITVNYRDITIIGQGGHGVNSIGIQLCDNWRWANTTLVNIKIYNVGTGISFGDFRPDIVQNNFENVTIYGCNKGIDMYLSNTAARVNYFKNVVVCGSSVKDWTIATNTFDKISNCADGDGSIALTGSVKTNNKTGVVPVDEFESLNPTSIDFLKLKLIDANIRISGTPRRGIAPHDVRFDDNLEYSVAGKILPNGGIVPTLSAVDLAGKSYGEFGFYPIGCYNAQPKVFGDVWEL
jgi:hypothetical protein